jgi:hypothetical protein
MLMANKVGEKFSDKQYNVALVLLFGFLTCIIIAIIQLLLTGVSETFKLVGTLFGGWVGTIIGFYFGQKPVEQVKAELEDERKRTKELTDFVKNRFDENEERRKELVLEMIKRSKNEENTDSS